MNINEFNTLTDKEKETVLWQQGTLVSNLKHRNNIWDNYLLEDFHVSVWFILSGNETETFYVAYDPSFRPNFYANEEVLRR